MDKRIRKKINELLHDKKLRNRKTVMISIISVVLVLSVTYMTILSAVTLTGKPVCGLEEHTHTEECYAKVLVCGKEETEGHIHIDACYKVVQTLAC